MLKGRELTKQYGGVTVLDAVSVEIREGECLAIVGENGCGKSTLLSLLAMAQRPDGGTVELEGVGRESIGYMPQDIALFDELTVLENLRCFCRKGGRAAGERIAGLCRDLGLEPLGKKQVGKLSGGQRRKVSFAAALVNDPVYLLLDEPFAGVDKAGEEQMLSLIRRALEKGTGVAVVVHHMEVVELIHRVVVMEGGRVLREERT